MNIHEFQAKALLAEHGVSVPRGSVAETAPAARRIAEGLGGRVVVKAQIHAGGRGKGKFQGSGERALGGVAVVDGAAAAEETARRMLGQVLVTRQTGLDGRTVRRVLVEEGLPIAREYYLALLLDRALKALTFVASREGGTEIEEVAASRPEAILRVPVDPRAGFSPWIGRKLAFGLGLSAERVADFVRLAGALYAAYVARDASLVEINPLVETTDGRLLALDAKLNFDDNALARHPELRELRDLGEEAPLEVEASRHSLNYIKLDGNVGCMVNGAGLAMATMDIIKLHGGSPANFLDVGGGASAEMVTEAFRILLADPNVQAVLINIFGGIMRCDVLAEGVVAAAKNVGVRVPVVVRLEGTNVEQGRRILLQSGLSFQVAEGMEDAARRVVAAVGGR
ncbi:MAG TPA: ADP-forming succinate--CoA ligase subunit beta [Candidatus Polarisedimenticolaceae bacterium]|nr:ADP-forming succinate--CoA ligase subunit beta [Candidatus Polarisedimenticolaceae bacterium]